MFAVVLLFFFVRFWRFNFYVIINMFFKEAIATLEKNWNAVDALAKTLLSDGFIHGDRTLKIIRKALASQQLDEPYNCRNEFDISLEE